MKLDKRQYTGYDILKISLRLSPFLMSLSLALVLLTSIIQTSGLAVATGYFVDNAMMVLNGGLNIEMMYLPLFLLLVVICVLSLSNNLMELFLVKVKFALERNLAPIVLDKQSSLAYKHIENRESMDLVERVGDDMIEIFMQSLRAYATVLSCIVAIIAIGALIVAQVWWSFWLIVFFCIPLLIIAFWSGQRTYAAKVETRQYERRYSYYSDEVLSNRESVEERTLFAYSETVTGRYYEDFVKARDIQLRVLLKTRIAMKLSSIALVLISILIALVFIKPLMRGDVSPGMFIGIISALLSLVDTFGWRLQDAAKDLTEAQAYMKDFTVFMTMEITQGASDLPDTEFPAFESLEFIDVYFKYPNTEHAILNGLSLKVEKGKNYAIVGANGAGKTTITKLMTKVYDDYQGQILLNGKDLRDFPLSSIKALFSIIYQDFSRYEISMAANISLGHASEILDDDALVKAATQAGLAATLNRLDRGIHTPLGRLKRDSLDLSSGQWQKLAIARSLVSPAPIKILDEPTSALDPIAEHDLYTEFESLMIGKTTLFISHRLGSTKLSDVIFVIDQGRVVETGSHAQLMREKGRYFEMYDSQKGWYS